jgi:hypothetical protein
MARTRPATCGNGRDKFVIILGESQEDLRSKLSGEVEDDINLDEGEYAAAACG